MHNSNKPQTRGYNFFSFFRLLANADVPILSLSIGIPMDLVYYSLIV